MEADQEASKGQCFNPSLTVPEAVPFPQSSLSRLHNSSSGPVTVTKPEL